MQQAEFAEKWRALAPRTTERAAYQEHWRDLCLLLGKPTPSSDPTGQDYNNRKSRRERYWQLGEVMPAMRRALAPLSRYLATSIVAKHRAFVWCEARDLPSGRLVVVASDQDWMYGVLNSHVHVVWAQRAGSTHEDRPVYTSTTCFETFPFPEWTADTQTRVGEAARFLEVARSAMRDQGYTLTGMLNLLADGGNSASPAYTLRLAQERLDEAAAAAYGWAWPLSEAEVLTRLLALNGERATRQDSGAQ